MVLISSTCLLRGTLGVFTLSKYYYWDLVLKSLVTIQCKSSNSFRGSQNFRTLFVGCNDGEGVVVLPQSVVKVRIEKEEVPFCNIKSV